MKRKELVNFLILKNFTENTFNSNNAWGFGGARGKRYTLNNITVTIARAGTRHCGEFPFIKVVCSNNDKFIDTKQTAKSYQKVVDFVNTYLI